MDFILNIQSRYEQFWKNIIQPQRQQYSQENLGPQVRLVNNIPIKMNNFTVKNKRNEKLECSFFFPEICQSTLPCVIYLHGNSGSRMEALTTLNFLLPNIALLCFDFSGSGKSEGQYVTMGVNECEDLEYVVQFAKKNLPINKVILWGRSMGAVTGILYASKNSQEIEAMILDSPFSNLEQVLEEIANSKTKIPNMIINGVILLIKNKINDVLKKSIFDINLEDEIKKCTIPILFIYAQNDTVILPYHTERLYKAYENQKNIIKFEGNHNSIRPNYLFQDVIKFITDQFKTSFQKLQQASRLKKQILSPGNEQKSQPNSDDGQKLNQVVNAKVQNKQLPCSGPGSQANINIKNQPQQQVQMNQNPFSKEQSQKCNQNLTPNQPKSQSKTGNKGLFSDYKTQPKEVSQFSYLVKNGSEQKLIEERNKADELQSNPATDIESNQQSSNNISTNNQNSNSNRQRKKIFEASNNTNKSISSKPSEAQQYYKDSAHTFDIVINRNGSQSVEKNLEAQLFDNNSKNPHHKHSSSNQFVYCESELQYQQNGYQYRNTPKPKEPAQQQQQQDKIELMKQESHLLDDTDIMIEKATCELKAIIQKKNDMGKINTINQTIIENNLEKLQRQNQRPQPNNQPLISQQQLQNMSGKDLTQMCQNVQIEKQNCSIKTQDNNYQGNQHQGHGGQGGSKQYQVKTLLEIQEEKDQINQLDELVSQSEYVTPKEPIGHLFTNDKLINFQNNRNQIQIKDTKYNQHGKYMNKQNQLEEEASSLNTKVDNCSTNEASQDQQKGQNERTPLKSFNCQSRTCENDSEQRQLKLQYQNEVKNFSVNIQQRQNSYYNEFKPDNDQKALAQFKCSLQESPIRRSPQMKENRVQQSLQDMPLHSNLGENQGPTIQGGQANQKNIVNINSQKTFNPIFGVSNAPINYQNQQTKQIPGEQISIENKQTLNSGRRQTEIDSGQKNQLTNNNIQMIPQEDIPKGIKQALQHFQNRYQNSLNAFTQYQPIFKDNNSINQVKQNATQQAYTDQQVVNKQQQQQQQQSLTQQQYNTLPINQQINSKQKLENIIQLGCKKESLFDTNDKKQHLNTQNGSLATIYQNETLETQCQNRLSQQGLITNNEQKRGCISILNNDLNIKNFKKTESPNQKRNPFFQQSTSTQRNQLGQLQVMKNNQSYSTLRLTENKSYQMEEPKLVKHAGVQLVGNNPLLTRYEQGYN